jgi:uncharacterized damage-inducible protein DinB
MADKTMEQLWLYNNWANEILFKTFDNYGAKTPASSLRLLSHIFNAQSNWLDRMTGKKQTVGLWDEYDLDGCKKWHQETSRAMKALLEEHADPHEKFEYTNSRGMTFQNTFFDALFQIFNHSTYHRGQIAMDLRRNGLEPVNTDYISFVR